MDDLLLKVVSERYEMEFAQYEELQAVHDEFVEQWGPDHNYDNVTVFDDDIDDPTMLTPNGKFIRHMELNLSLETAFARLHWMCYYIHHNWDGVEHRCSRERPKFAWDADDKPYIQPIAEIG